jgi:hypothetical protein
MFYFESSVHAVHTLHTHRLAFNIGGITNMTELRIVENPSLCLLVLYIRNTSYNTEFRVIKFGLLRLAEFVKPLLSLQGHALKY